MKFLFYTLGTLTFLAGFADGPNVIPFVVGFILLTIAYNFGDTIDKGIEGISSKKASEKLLTLTKLKEKGILTQDEYDLKVRELKDKL
jgi:hypothetical protein